MDGGLISAPTAAAIAGGASAAAPAAAGASSLMSYLAPMASALTIGNQARNLLTPKNSGLPQQDDDITPPQISSNVENYVPTALRLSQMLNQRKLY